MNYEKMTSHDHAQGKIKPNPFAGVGCLVPLPHDILLPRPF